LSNLFTNASNNQNSSLNQSIISSNTERRQRLNNDKNGGSTNDLLFLRDNAKKITLKGSSYSIKRIVGLKNLGNTCYM